MKLLVNSHQKLLYHYFSYILLKICYAGPAVVKYKSKYNKMPTRRLLGFLRALSIHATQIIFLLLQILYSAYNT